MTILATLDNS